MNKMLVVLKYEFKKIAMTRTFLVITVLGPFLLAAITILPAVLTIKFMDRTNADLHFGIYSNDENVLSKADAVLSPLFKDKGWSALVSGDEASLRARVLSGDLDGYLSVPRDFPLENTGDGYAWYSKSTTDVFIFGAVEDIVSSVVVATRLKRASVDETLVRSLMEKVSLPVFKVSASASDDGKETSEKDFLASMFTGLAFCMLIYMTVLLYGQQIGRSVVAEKSSKIVDILLSSVRSEDLLYGKLLGIGLAGLLQYAVWISVAALILGVVGPAVHLQIPIHIGMDKFVFLVFFFIGGYLLYSSLYAACGAASEDDQHMAQLSMPILIFLMLPMMIIQVIIQQPDSLFSVVLSYFPFTSPMVMLIRILSSDVSLLEIAISIVILALTVLAMGKLASKIFRVGILMTGKNFAFKDIFVWLRS